MSIGALIAISAIGCQPSVGEGTASKSVAEIGLGARKDSAAIGAIPLEELIDRTLDFNRDRRLLSVDRNAAWQVAHGAVAYGNDLKLLVDGKTVLALEYLLSGGEMRGWQL